MNQFGEEKDDGHRQANTQTDGGPVESPGDGAGADSAPAPGEGTGEGAGTGDISPFPLYAVCTFTAAGWQASLPTGTYATNVFMFNGAPAVAYAYEAPKLEVMPPEVGEIIAWRAWKVHVTKDGYRLMSVTQDAIWEPNEPMSGNPLDSGLFGVYSSKTRELIAESPYGTYSLIGEVAIWGDVVEHENGYRSQFARVLSLEFNGDIAVISETGADYPKDMDAVRLLNFLRCIYGLPYDEMTKPPVRYSVWRAFGKNVVRTGAQLVVYVSAFFAALTVARFVVWLIQKLLQE